MGSTGTGGAKGETTGPFQFGPSQFDLSQIMGATSGNEQATTNRYDQLGMGGSTPEQQDLAQQNLLGQAAEGQVQTSEVTNPAFNPALQTPSTNQQGTVIGTAVGSALGGLSKLAGSG